MATHFDSRAVEVTPYDLPVGCILKSIEGGSIIIPDEVEEWDNVTKSRFIESLIMRIPCPSLYFESVPGVAGDQCCRKIVVGANCIRALKEFFVDKTLTLEGVEFIEKCGGCTCNDLSVVFTRWIKDTILHGYMLRPGCTEEVNDCIIERLRKFAGD